MKEDASAEANAQRRSMVERAQTIPRAYHFRILFQVVDFVTCKTYPIRHLMTLSMASDTFTELQLQPVLANEPPRFSRRSNEARRTPRLQDARAGRDQWLVFVS